MYGSKHKSDAIDDFSDLEGGSNLYQICENKKIAGASNAELREFLKENGISDDEIREWVRQIDSDFLAGRLVPKKPKYSILPPLVGILLLLAGLWMLVSQMITGMTNIFLIWFGFGISSMGIGLISYNAVKRHKQTKNRMKSTSRRDHWNSRQQY